MRIMKTCESNRNIVSYTLQGAGGIGGLLSVTEPRQYSTNQYLPAYDANGNITEYADTNATIVAHYEYNPFGGLITSSGTKANDFKFRFSTKYFDVETGLYYYGYRYYSSELGRWINRDPVNTLGTAAWQKVQKVQKEFIIKLYYRSLVKMVLAKTSKLSSRKRIYELSAINDLRQIKRILGGEPKMALLIGGINIYESFVNSPIVVFDRNGLDNDWGGAPPWGGGNQNAPAVCQPPQEPPKPPTDQSCSDKTPVPDNPVTSSGSSDPVDNMDTGTAVIWAGGGVE